MITMMFMMTIMHFVQLYHMDICKRCPARLFCNATVCCIISMLLHL